MTLIQLSPNPASDQIILILDSKYAANIRIDILDMQGRKIRTIFDDRVITKQKSIFRKIGDLPAGTYTIRAVSTERQQKGIVTIQTAMLIKQ